MLRDCLRKADIVANGTSAVCLPAKNRVSGAEGTYRICCKNNAALIEGKSTLSSSPTSGVLLLNLG